MVLPMPSATTVAGRRGLGPRAALSRLGAAGPLPVLAACAAVALVASAVAVAPLGDAGRDPGDILVLVGLGLAVAVCAALGGLVLASRPGHGVGRALLGGGCLASLWIVGMAWADGVPPDGGRPLLTWAGWLENWAFVGMLVLVTWPLLLFPDGRLPGRRWRPVAWALAGGLGAIALRGILDPGPLQDAPGLRNPLPVPESWATAVGALGIAGFGVPIGVVAGMVAVHVRARRDQGPGMRAGLWAARLLAANFVLWIALHDVAGGAVYAVTLTACVAAFAGAATVAVVRHGVIALDPDLRRAFLVAGEVGAGLLVAAGAFALGASIDAAGPAIVTGCLVAAAVAVPALRGVGRAVERLLYGHRDPAVASVRLTREAARAGDGEEGLDGFAREICEALGAAHAAIVPAADVPLEAGRWGASAGQPAVVRPLVHSGRTLGRLELGARGTGEGYAPSDLALVDLLVRQLAPTVEALRLAAELARSRDEIVRAREEERRALRRDLHDGLGPALAGIALMLDAARHAPERDGLLDEARVQARVAIDDVRRIARGLRPPALDQLGLVEAVRIHSARLGPLEVEVAAERALPAAVELALYRAATEALTNVVRHSGARRCRVNIRTAGDEVVLSVEDDGAGMSSEAGQGVGLASIRERAAELGGRVELMPGELGGLRLRMRLPVPAGGGA